MLTATETVTVHSYREGSVTRTLYPGSLVWDPVEETFPIWFGITVKSMETGLCRLAR